MGAMDVSLFKDDATIKSAAASCGSEDANLQDVTPYCDVGLVVMDDAGEYHFMPTSVPVVPPRSSGRISRRPRAVASKCAPVHFSSRHPANDQTACRFCDPI